MKCSIKHFLAFVIAGTTVQAASAADATNSINFGLGGLNPMPHCDAMVYTFEYEHKITPTVSLLGRGSTVDYTSDETNYREDGDLQGADIGLRYYPSARMQGFYTGGSIGYWTGDWSFNKNSTKPTHQEGKAESRAIRLNIGLGYRYPIRNTRISIMPEVNLGNFFSSSTCEFTAPASQIGAKCNQESVVDGYIFAGMSIGFAF